MSLMAGCLGTARTLSFDDGADVVVFRGPEPGAFVLVPSLSSRIEDVPAFLKEVRDNPEGADESVIRHVEAVREDIKTAFAAKASGTVYWIEGASPSAFTPMQYGGLFLEQDRELLDFARSLGETVVFIADPQDAYIDFVCDLPGDLFGWDIANGVEPEAVRGLRSGRLLADHPDADVRLTGDLPRRRTF